MRTENVKSCNGNVVKTTFISLLLMGLAMNINAQLRVEPNGFVSIASPGRVLSNFSVGAGSDGYAACVKGSLFDKCGLYVDAGGQRIERTVVGVRGDCISSGNSMKVGLMGYALQPTPVNNGFSMGVVGIAGNSANGKNYGVCGLLNGSNNGAGIYGASSNGTIANIDGKYAGYFSGSTKVVGQLTTTGTLNGILVGTAPNSANTIDVIEESFSNRLSSLQAISYYQTANEQAETITFEDTICTQPEQSSLERQVLERHHYGLQTDQLKDAFPELVYEQEDGTTAVNYVELIPILVQTINELTDRIQTLEGSGPKKAKATSVNDVNAEETYLLQNTPNPSNSTTTISYSIPANTSSAEICICDMAGQMKKSVNLTEKGKASITVSTHDLSSGIYLYSLIVNGEVCATKRMIVKQ